jgi:hypothetical protein
MEGNSARRPLAKNMAAPALNNTAWIAGEYWTCQIAAIVAPERQCADEKRGADTNKRDRESGEGGSYRAGEIEFNAIQC